MVSTRSQAKLMVDQTEEPQLMTGESSRDVRIFFTDKVVDKMEELASEVASMKVEYVEIRI